MKDIYVEKIGNVLRQSREEKNQTIDSVSKATKINPTYIKALETGDIGVFPAPVFCKGFLKNYSVFLEIDSEQILNDYSGIFEKSSKNQETPEVGTPAAENEKKRSDYIKYGVLLGIVALIIFSWLKVVQVNYEKRTDIEKRISTSFKTMTTSKELALHEEKKKLLGFNDKLGDLIELRAIKDCWVEIRYQNSNIFQGLLLAGEKREFTYKKGLLIRLGNAGGVEIIVKGDVRKNLGKTGEVREILID